MLLCPSTTKAAPLRKRPLLFLRRRRGCCMQCLVPGDEVGLLLFMDGLVRGRWVEADQPLDRLFAQDVLAVELGHAGILGVVPSACESRARIFSSRAFLAMPSSSSVWLASELTCSMLSLSLWPTWVMPTFLPPAKISWRPCSSYHLVRVAVMCIFSMMLRQPMPVL